MPVPTRPRRLLTAELLSIGTELTVGETRDTNAAELAASLTTSGVAVGRISALPDRLDVVADAFRSALGRVDLVVSTGGLGPTPDDLTREAVAQVFGETPVVDPASEAWLRELWARRDLPFPESNRKQAWLIPSATALPNPNGTAPGWLAIRPDGRCVVTLPGPPREMRPMWQDHVLPALRDRGLGADVASRTFRLTGIGESQVAELLGDELLRRPNPEVATYARAEAVDVRVSAVGGPGGDAASLVAEASAVIETRLAAHIWAQGAVTWGQAVGTRLDELGWRLATCELGLRGALIGVFGDVDWLARGEVLPADGSETTADALVAEARRVRDAAGVEVGLAVRVRERGADTAVSIAVASPNGEHHERRMAFLGGSHGRTRAALLAAAVLLAELRR
jgi:nicotinamide-nucleotide amidase